MDSHFALEERDIADGMVLACLARSVSEHVGIEFECADDVHNTCAVFTSTAPRLVIRVGRPAGWSGVFGAETRNDVAEAESERVFELGVGA